MRRKINSLGYNIDGSRSNAELLAPVVVDSRSTADLALILTGMHIENILKNMHTKKHFSSVKATPREKKRPDIFRSNNLRKSTRQAEGGF